MRNEARVWGLWLTVYGAVLAAWLAQKSAQEDYSGHLERIIELLEKKDIPKWCTMRAHGCS